jgi:hypothetical protein
LLQQPAFELLGQGSRLFAEIFAAYTPFDLKLSDVRVENSNAQSPADLAVAVSILKLSSLVRFRLDRVEISAPGLGLASNPELAIPLVKATRSVLGILIPSVQIRQHSIGVGFHAEVVGGTADEQIAKLFVGTPSVDPKLVPTGASFACSWSSGNFGLVVERSAAMAGIYMRLTSDHGPEISEADSLTKLGPYLRNVLGQLGFDLQWRG